MIALLRFARIRKMIREEWMRSVESIHRKNTRILTKKGAIQKNRY